MTGRVMKKEEIELNQGSDLRRLAEDRLKEGRSGSANTSAEESANAVALVHELQVHQIELEMQNEELKRARLVAEEALEKYSDLYDFAPIGLFTLDEQGRILESNLTGASLLGVERRNLSKKSFRRFVAPKDRPNFDDFCKKAFETSIKQTCELLLLKKDGPPVYARVEGTAAEVSSRSRRRAELRECRIVVIDITETKLAEKALRQLKNELELRVCERTADLAESNRALMQSEEHYLALAENAPDVIARFDRQMRYQYVNAAIELITGLPSDEVVRKTNRELGMPQEIVSIMEKNLHDVFATGKSVTIEYQYAGFAGKRYYETRLVPEFTTKGAVESVLAVTRDITERKLAEEELAFQASLLANINDAVVATDDQYHITYWNKAAEQIYGWTASEVMGKNSYQTLRPESSDKHRAATVQALRTGETIRGDYLQHRKDGSFVWIEATVITLYDADGAVTGYASVNRDITERKRMEDEILERTAELEKVNKALQESEMQYKQLADLSPNAICVYVGDRIVFVNNAAVNLIGGLNPEDFIGKSIFDFVHEDYWEFCRKRVNRILEQNETNPAAEYKLIRVEGEVIDAEMASAPIIYGGRPAVLSVGRDITARKQAEKELMAAKEAAEAAAQAKSDFMASMSHELRTPMNAVIGMTSILLEDGDLTAEQKDFIETIRLSGDALMTVINDILDFSKMESNKVALEEQPFNLRGTIEEALELVNIKAVEKGLNLAYTIDPSVPETIISDPARLRQIIGNLLSNAIKFTNRGEVKLSVSSSVSSSRDDVREIHFAIHDTGIGITCDKLDLLFQPFSQIEPSSYGSESGTGLGLVISKKLVEMMNGRIWALSEPEIGSTFHFTILAETVPGELAAHLKGVQPHLMGRHVLIVDDNKTNRRILGAYTYSWGMVPFIASKGHDALDWIKRGDTFDVAILDMDMSDMNGLTLAEEIKKYNKTLPLVMLTSIGKRVPVKHAFHLTKPIRPSLLHKALIEIISIQTAQKSTRYGSVVMREKARPLCILLAEDNASSQKVILHMLKRLGYRADVVANGIEVCQALEHQNYDIVLMDVRMPEMDGLEATRTIRQRWPLNGPKVIAITAHALQGDREKCLGAGMDDYITKPVKMEELAEVLKRYCPS